MCWGSLVAVSAHINLIYPKPRNAIDSLLPEWSGGKSPYAWEAYGDPPCGCTNGSDVCESAQTCLWFSVGCFISYKECDGGDKGPTNPNIKDLCGSGLNATVNDPLQRTINRHAVAGSDEDWTKFNSWKCTCLRSVRPRQWRPTCHRGSWRVRKHKICQTRRSGFKFAQDPLRRYLEGSTVETRWTIRANHGGGYQYRLCPSNSNMTEECFQQTTMPFAGGSSMMLGNGTMVKLNSTFVSEATLPAGSTWQMNPIPGYVVEKDGGWTCCKRWFDPPCYDPIKPARLGQGRCSGEWITKVT